MASYERSASSKLWSVRFRETLEDGTTTQRRLSGFKTKKEAQEAYEKWLAQSEAAKNVDHKDMLFDAVYEKYLERQKMRTKGSAFVDIESKTRSLILPTFSGKRMSEITPTFVLEWENLMVQTKAYNTVHWIVSYLSSIMTFAYRYFDIPNVMDKVDRPRRMEQKKPKAFWTPDQLKSVLPCLEDRPEMRMLVLFLFTTGCRKGEAFALSWQDIDFRARTVRIDKSMTFKTHDGDKAFSITSPKTAISDRVIPIPQFLCDELMHYFDWQMDNVEGNTFVFGGGKNMSQASVDRWFRAASVQAGVPIIHIHDLRHSFVNNMIRNGINIVAISHHLGHKNVETTYNEYCDWMPEDDYLIRAVQEGLSHLIE